MADATTKQLRAVNRTTTHSGFLNSLANNALSVSSVTLGVNDGLDYVLVEVEAVVTFPVAPTANTGLSVWFLRTIDGTNYENGDDNSTTPARAPDCVLPVRAVTTEQRIIVVALLPPGAFKVLLKNDGTGQAFASSGNTLKIRPLTFLADEA